MAGTDVQGLGGFSGLQGQLNVRVLNIDIG